MSRSFSWMKARRGSTGANAGGAERETPLHRAAAGNNDTMIVAAPLDACAGVNARAGRSRTTRLDGAGDGEPRCRSRHGVVRRGRGSDSALTCMTESMKYRYGGRGNCAGLSALPLARPVAAALAEASDDDEPAIEDGTPMRTKL